MNKNLLLTIASGIAIVTTSSAQEIISEGQPGFEQCKEAMMEQIRIPLDKTPSYINAHGLEDFEDVYKTMATDKGVSTNGATENELHAAINPKDENNIVVSTLGNDKDFALQMPIFYTKNNGAAWSLSPFLPMPRRSAGYSVGGGDPVFAFDANAGRLYYTWLDVNFPTTTGSGALYFGMYWAYSDNGGVNWTVSPDPVIWEGQGTVSNGQIVGISKANPDKQWIAVDNSNSANKGTLYCVFARAILPPSPGSPWELVLKKKGPASPSFGTFETAITTGATFPFAQFVNCQVDNAGVLHVSFIGRKAGTNTVDIYYTKSTNGGNSFSTPVKVTGYRYNMQQVQGSTDAISGIPTSRANPSPYMVVDPMNANNIYITFTAFGLNSAVAPTNGANVYVVKSSNAGTTWETPKIVNDDNTTSATHNYYSSIAVDKNGDLAVSWYDRRDDVANNKAHYYYAVSTDKGVTWKTNQKASSVQTDFSKVGLENKGFGIGEYNQLILTDKYIIPVWSDGRKGTGDNDPYVAVISRSATGIESASTITTQLWANEIYPNPVNGEASITFGLKNRENVTVRITDMLGKEVTVLAARLFDTGENTLKFSAKELAKGPYFITIDAESGRAVRKFVVN